MGGGTRMGMGRVTAETPYWRAKVRWKQANLLEIIDLREKQKMTYKKIAIIYGVSAVRARQVYMQAVRYKLKDKI